MVLAQKTFKYTLLPEVQTFLSKSPKKFFVGGEWVAASSNETFKTLNPGSGQELAEVASGDRTDIDQAVEAAQTAFQKSGWATMEPNDRGVLLHRLADLVEKQKSILGQIESLDVGKILAQAEGDMTLIERLMSYQVDFDPRFQMGPGAGKAPNVSPKANPFGRAAANE